MNELDTQRVGGVQIISMDANGVHTAGTTSDRPGSHVYMTADMDEPEFDEGNIGTVRGQMMGICRG